MRYEFDRQDRRDVVDVGTGIVHDRAGGGAAGDDGHGPPGPRFGRQAVAHHGAVIGHHGQAPGHVAARDLTPGDLAAPHLTARDAPAHDHVPRTAADHLHLPALLLSRL